MITFRCRHATFPTSDVARRCARAMDPDRRKQMQPTDCPACGKVRLVAPAAAERADAEQQGRAA